jgi:hypothetical protein
MNSYFFWRRRCNIFSETYKLLVEIMVPTYQTTCSHTQQDCSNNPYCGESLKPTFFQCVLHWQGFLYPTVTSTLKFLWFTNFLKGCWETELGTSACIRTDSLLIQCSHSLTQIISASTTLQLLVKKTKGRGKICSNRGNTRYKFSLFTIF